MFKKKNYNRGHLSDFPTEMFKGRSLSLSLAVCSHRSSSMTRSPLRAASGSNAGGEPAEPCAQPAGVRGGEPQTLAAVSKVTQKFCVWPEQREQNSLFASLILLLKGYRPSFSVERSVTRGEHENVKKYTSLCAFEIGPGGVTGFHV